MQPGRHVAVFLSVPKNMGAVAPLLSPFTSNIYRTDWSGELVARVGSSAVPFWGCCILAVGLV